MRATEQTEFGAIDWNTFQKLPKIVVLKKIEKVVWV